jgi:C1A family cysteine protease
MKVIIALALVACVSASILSTEEYETLFSKWMAMNGKEYSSPEEMFERFHIYQKNLDHIIQHNSKGLDWTLGMNQFGDLTNEEFRATYLGFKGDSSVPEHVEEVELTAPTTVNWVQSGIVPPILNQQQCGSCWAFSAAGSISMAYNKNNNNNALQLSPEQLVQCSAAYGNNGCNGGLMDNAFRYAQKYPLATLAQYPYTSGNGVTGQCNTSLQSQGKYGVKSYTNVSKGSYTALQNAIAIQPVSVAVDAQNWQNYNSGIFSKCGTSLDHGVIAVGYTPTYTLVRNSWGTSWGLQGYIQLAPGNTCGIANQASYPTV